MKNYHYKAKKGPAEIVEGDIAADSRENAIDKVNDLGLVPVDISEKSAEDASGKPSVRRTVKRVRSRDLLQFYMQLSRLVKSGVSLLQALFLLSKQGEQSAFRVVVEDLTDRVRQGSSLSDAMSLHPRIFPPFDIGMVQTGEAAGRLDEVLGKVASYRGEQHAMAGKIRGAIAYPAFIIIMSIVTVAFMLTNVIPKFARFFKDLGQELPLMTRILIAVSGWMQSYWYFVLLGAAALYFLLRRLYSKPAHREKLDRSLLGLPLVGDVFLKAEIARLCRTLELLLKSGVSLLAGVRIAIPVLKNEALKQDLRGCYRHIEEGGTLSEGLGKSELVPQFVCYFVGMGEESGRLSDSLEEIAQWYEQDTQEAIKIMTSLLEPAIILVVGAILAFIVISVLLPVFSINAMVG